tara:strand:+ start:50 stop:517 length:468 start_codon:yes stop_codon:yes gene_type:complete
MKIKITTLFFLFATNLSAFSKTYENKLENLHFTWNKDFYLSQTGEILNKGSLDTLSLVGLFGAEDKKFILIDSFYRIQKKFILHNLEIKSLSISRSGNIKALLKEGQEIKFQQHKLEEQLLRLNLFLISNESQKLIKNFESIDLRYKTKIAIKYF